MHFMLMRLSDSAPLVGFVTVFINFHQHSAQPHFMSSRGVRNPFCNPSPTPRPGLGSPSPSCSWVGGVGGGWEITNIRKNIPLLMIKLRTRMTDANLRSHVSNLSHMSHMRDDCHYLMTIYNIIFARAELHSACN